MANERDKKIQELWNVVQQKKAQIAKLEKPNYKTNLSFVLDEQNATARINLQVINDIPTLVKQLARLTTMKKAFDDICFDLDLNEEFKHCGFTYDEWKHDIIAIIRKVNIKKEKDDLAHKEKRLNDLISPEEKERLELEAIEKELMG